MSNARFQSALEHLRQILGPEGLIEDDESLAGYVAEPRGRFRDLPLAVARPDSTGQVSEVVAICREAQLPIIAQGGNTGLVGGSAVTRARAELIVNLGRMRRIRAVDTAGATMVAEAGCTLTEVQQAASEAGLIFPLSYASEGTATIGGALATNGGGNLTIRYGNARARVLGLEVVLADGRVYRGLKSLRKDNAGFDLDQFFIGSEGLLGIITAASLALAPTPRQTVTAMVAVNRLEDLLGLLELARKRLGETLSAFEMLPRLALDFVLEHLPDARDPFDQPAAWYGLIQADSSVAGDWLETAVIELLGAAGERGMVQNSVLATSEKQRRELWQLREAISPAQKAGGVSLKHDISVPTAAIADFVSETCAALQAQVPGIRPCVFGHVGDGNLHFNLSQPTAMPAERFLALEADCNRIVFDQVARHHGSIAAEHGIGLLRAGELSRSADKVRLDLMRSLKHAFDPDKLLNPGKMIFDEANEL